jgi:hypothetical protein
MFNRGTMSTCAAILLGCRFGMTDRMVLTPLTFKPRSVGRNTGRGFRCINYHLSPLAVPFIDHLIELYNLLVNLVIVLANSQVDGLR